MNEVHAIRYSIHPGVDKMYYDLRGLYWWPGMRKDIAMYVNECLTCSTVKVVKGVGLVASRLRLLQELVGFHDMFRVSSLKKYLVDVNLHVPLEEIKIDKGLCFVEEPIEVMDREFVSADGILGGFCLIMFLSGHVLISAEDLESVILIIDVMILGVTYMSTIQPQRLEDALVSDLKVNSGTYLPTQSPVSYPNPNPSASPSFTQDDTSESFIPEPSQQMPTFTQPAFSQPAFSQPNQSIFSQPVVTFNRLYPTQTNRLVNSTPNKWSTKSQNSVQLFQTVNYLLPTMLKFPYLEKENMRYGYEDEYWIKMLIIIFGGIVSKGTVQSGWEKMQRKYNCSSFVSLGFEHVAVQRRISFKALEWSSVMCERLCCSNHLLSLELPVWSKLTYLNQQSIVPSVYQTSGRSDNIMECVLHSFVAENEPDQDMIYEDFDQVDQLEMEELTLKWTKWLALLRIILI
ncbi:putative reverse transcriptase domain-containing protein [Tanacetum coccineum]